jgi:hypothetical protein
MLWKTLSWSTVGRYVIFPREFVCILYIQVNFIFHLTVVDIVQNNPSLDVATFIIVGLRLYQRA